MAATNPDRASYFPAIETKHGQPMAYWFDQMQKIKGLKYAEQIAYLRENHGFSQVHADALVLYSRGNTTSRRFNTFNDYLTAQDPIKRKTLKRIFATITESYPDLEVVIAWNQPMIKQNSQYVFGAGAVKNHILISPWNSELIEAFRPRLTGYKVNKKTIQVPVDWDVDEELLLDLIAAQLGS